MMTGCVILIRIHPNGDVMARKKTLSPLLCLDQILMLVVCLFCLFCLRLCLFVFLVGLVRFGWVWFGSVWLGLVCCVCVCSFRLVCSVGLVYLVYLVYLVCLVWSISFVWLVLLFSVFVSLFESPKCWDSPLRNWVQGTLDRFLWRCMRDMVLDPQELSLWQAAQLSRFLARNRWNRCENEGNPKTESEWYAASRI